MKSTTKTVLDTEIIQKIMEKHFGTVQVQKVTELTEGWFNAIYVVEYTKGDEEVTVVLKTGVETGKYVLTYEKNLMQAELQVYDLLQDTIIPTADILARDFSHDVIDCDYFIMEYLTGDNWGHLDASLIPENRDLLVAELAEYTAALHQIKGKWFGYLKDDTFYQYPTWREAFQGMVQMMIDDGKAQNLDLPYDELLAALEPYLYLMDDIQEPCLVNFDMWTKNIMLKKKEDEVYYHIDAIIDLERAFYGDPKADFISSNTVVGDVSTCQNFMDHYSKISGKEFTYTQRDRVRHAMYWLYLIIMGGVEVYRKTDEQERAEALQGCRDGLKQFTEVLKEAAAKLEEEF